VVDYAIRTMASRPDRACDQPDGIRGGLVMSAIKRDRGVKDWGWTIEGHGGVLDRLDSVIFAAPIFFHVTRYWWTP
jgi:phosphatidate cytidylyltransferase